MIAVEVVGLEKRYGDTVAVAGIDFRVEQGEVFALLGPNGAGKTTTVEILEGYRVPDRGTVRVLDREPGSAPPSWRDRIGIVLQQSGIEKELTVREALTRLARLYTRPAAVDHTIERVGLAEKAEARIKTLSGGQRRRVDMAAAIIGQPDLIFLDEPTTGFDPAARREAWRLVQDLTADGATVILTTHYLDEAQHLADRVAVIARGRIVTEGDPSTLGGRDRGLARVRFRTPSEPLPSRLGTGTNHNGWTELTTPTAVELLHALTSWALDRGIELDGLEVRRPSLEDVYLELIGADRAAEEAAGP
ncbi:MAG TPA: ABC transporter ATP-binding protein [Acidimicrobiia bacterium]|nr:ABC transporter ATP-binding protein [Acidimicrobiia bacterium]